MVVVPLRFGVLYPLFWVLGMTRGRSRLEIGPDRVDVRAGPWFSASVPRASIVSAVRSPDRPWSIGVHGWRGRWVVNGAAGPMVRITLAPPVPARSLGFRIRLRELEVSVDDPDGLVALLSGADATPRRG